MSEQNTMTCNKINFSFGGKRKKKLIKHLKMRKEIGEKVGSVGKRKEQVIVDVCISLLVKEICDFCESPVAYERNLKANTRKPINDEIDYYLIINDSLYYLVQYIFGKDCEEFCTRAIRYGIDKMITSELTKEELLSTYTLSWFNANLHNLNNMLSNNVKPHKLFGIRFSHEKRNIISGTFKELVRECPALKDDEVRVKEDIEQIYKNYKGPILSRAQFINRFSEEYHNINHSDIEATKHLQK